MSLRLLLLSTPVGPIGSGLGGGVESTVASLASVLANRGHLITVVAPAGSRMPFVHKSVSLFQVEGEWQSTAQTQERTSLATTSTVLANMWEHARQVETDYDLLVNFAYDWLPFYLTPFFKKPIAHFVSMGSLSDVMDSAIASIAAQFPHCLGAYTNTQTRTFKSVPSKSWTVLGYGLDLCQYSYCDTPTAFVAWVGRISPEKGLEDAIALATLARTKLKVFGKIEDPAYWLTVQAQIASCKAEVEYGGFLENDLWLQAGLAQALLMTPKWIEAFGIVAIEALACGVPVISYARGGPTEIVQNGRTGWLVTPDSVEELSRAVAHVSEINRYDCRAHAEATYTMPAWGDRFEKWFYQLLSSTIGS